MKIVLIRHAKTDGNIKRRYIGATDEPLAEGTEIKKSYPDVDVIISSPLKRCIQTAGLIYPGKDPVIYKDLAETDFGRFENKSYDELKNDRYYIKWLDSNGTLPFPGGETHEHFIKRCTAAYEKAVSELAGRDIAFVVHGGTIMAIMSRVFGGGFYDYQTDNLGGFVFDINGSRYDRI